MPVRTHTIHVLASAAILAVTTFSPGWQTEANFSDHMERQRPAKNAPLSTILVFDRAPLLPYF